jgi:CRISPR-associated protein Csb1
MNDELVKFDTWLTGDEVGALTARQLLQSVDGPDAVIFPPTFAAETEGEKGNYNIDYFDGKFSAKITYQHPSQEQLQTDVRHEKGANVCLINSVGAEANRVEIVFRPESCDGKYAPLVPQIIVQAGPQAVNLLDAGHRAGDALVRFTSVGERLFKSEFA